MYYLCVYKYCGQNKLFRTLRSVGLEILIVLTLSVIYKDNFSTLYLYFIIPIIYNLQVD